MPTLLTILSGAADLSLGFGLGWVVRAMLTPDAPPTEPVQPIINDPRGHRYVATVAEYERGFEAGYEKGTTAMREEAERLLAERFPTSTGGRRIVKALGGTVPPMPRIKRPASGGVSSADVDLGPVQAFNGPDMGEGPE